MDRQSESKETAKQKKARELVRTAFQRALVYIEPITCEGEFKYRLGISSGIWSAVAASFPVLSPEYYAADKEWEAQKALFQKRYDKKSVEPPSRPVTD